MNGKGDHKRKGKEPKAWITALNEIFGQDVVEYFQKTAGKSLFRNQA